MFILKNKKYIFAFLYILFILISFIFAFTPGEIIARNFFSFFLSMCKILPCAFILIGLFDVWIKKEAIEKHMGKESNAMSYVWAILLAAPIVGGLYIAFPIIDSLYKKGAKLSVIFTFLGAAAIARVPMTAFEISFLGLKFTLIRLAVSLPLVIISSIFLGRYLEAKQYTLNAKEQRSAKKQQ